MVPKYYRYSDFVHFSSDSVASLHTSILPKVYSHKKKKKKLSEMLIFLLL